MTIGEIEKHARELVLDTYEDDYRFPYAEVFLEIGNAIKRLNSVRPESRYVDMRLTSYSYPMISPTLSSKDEVKTIRETEINIEPRWMEALCYYVAHKLYMRDDSDTVNVQMAENYYKQFERIALT